MRKRQSQTLKVNKMYEPNRFAQMHLERVYEQVVPKQVFVLQPRLKTIKSANTSNEHKIKENIG